MQLTQKQKAIISEDIKDLKFLVDKYTKEGELEKASNCYKEMKLLQNKLKKEAI